MRGSKRSSLRNLVMTTEHSFSQHRKAPVRLKKRKGRTREKKKNQSPLESKQRAAKGHHTSDDHVRVEMRHCGRRKINEKISGKKTKNEKKPFSIGELGGKLNNPTL